MDESDYVIGTFICSQHPNVHTLSGREVVGVRLLAELIGSHLCRVLRQLRREVSLILLLSWPYWEQPNIYKPVLIAGIGRETSA